MREYQEQNPVINVTYSRQDAAVAWAFLAGLVIGIAAAQILMVTGLAVIR